jgi:hypothetical protein
MHIIHTYISFWNEITVSNFSSYICSTLSSHLIKTRSVIFSKLNTVGTKQEKGFYQKKEILTHFLSSFRLYIIAFSSLIVYLETFSQEMEKFFSYLRTNQCLQKTLLLYTSAQIADVKVTKIVDKP